MSIDTEKAKALRAALAEAVFEEASQEIGRIRNETNGRAILAFAFSVMDDGLGPSLGYLLHGDRSEFFAGKVMLLRPEEWPVRPTDATYLNTRAQSEPLEALMEDGGGDDFLITDAFERELRENIKMFTSVAKRLRDEGFVRDDEKFVLHFPHEEPWLVKLEAAFVGALNSKPFKRDWLSFRGASE